MCNHNTCATLHATHCAKSIGAAIMLNYYDNEYVCFLGREVGGEFAGQYNVIGGKMELRDQGCFLQCLAREVREECKFPTLNDDGSVNWQVLDAMFKGTDNTFHYFFQQGNVNKTPIFIGVVQGISRAVLRAKIQEDAWRDFAFNEMSDIEFVAADFKTVVNNQRRDPGLISPYARAVVNKAFIQVQQLRFVLPKGLSC